MAATALAVRPINSKPGGNSMASSPCDIQTARGPCSPLNSAELLPSNSTWAWPYSRLSAARTLPPSLVPHELKAVTDAQYRQAEMQDALVRRRRIGVVDGRWPTRQHNAGGRVALDL